MTRIAWIGTPMDTGSVTYIATQLLERLPERGITVDVYSPSVPDLVPQRLVDAEGLRFVFQQLRYQPNRWYSRTRMGGFLIGQSERALAQGMLAKRVADAHAQSPYSAVLQISQIELFALRALRHKLPPVVLYPHTHAAGELRWLRREAGLLSAEQRAHQTLARAVMRARAEVQYHDMALAEMVIAPSRRFADHLSTDYNYPRGRIAVVRNPIDMDRHRPPVRSGSAEAEIPILFISRISVRKGVEMVVRLSHALADLAGKVRIHVIGDHSAWSDYRPLLRSLNPDVSQYHGHVSPRDLAKLYQRAAMVVQPSHFEPFGLTIGEALATGVPVVASDEVGAVDGVDPSVCRVFSEGDASGFEAAVRDLLAEDLPERRGQLAETARAEASRLFSADRSADDLARALRQLAQTPPRRGQASATGRRPAWR